MEASARGEVVELAAGRGPTTQPIPPGSTGETLVFTVPASDLMGLAAEVAVDDIGDGSGVIFECLEDNNKALGETLVCAG